MVKDFNSSRTVMIYIFGREEKRREEKRYLIVRVSVDTIHCLAMKEKSSKREGGREGDFVRFAPNKVLRNSEPLDPPFPRNWNSQR